MRRPKAIRKQKSIYHRSTFLKFMVKTFQSAYVKAQGNPKKRFEEACKATDDVIRQMANAEPEKKSFYMIAVDDFKNYLLTLVENEELIARASEAAKQKNESKEVEAVAV